jgi:hemin uptake protein HemP
MERVDLTKNAEAGGGLRGRNSLHSHELFGEGKELTIMHNQEEYTLRITSNQKLILTK